MEPTFKTKGDAMEWGYLWNRKKLIHSIGAVGKVKFVPSPSSPFTGIFSGANYGLVRLSSAAAPAKSGQPLAPGFGLKFLRDGIDSANLVAMVGIEGTPGDWNMFSKDFVTIIGPTDNTVLKIVAAKFSTATDHV